ncbi:hypothetical protein K438DRAFT_2104743 [Mycena galopus ATCC 62051]|nr:hypothetical protein K438DRAFT_2104743 [Mycena galopus ATCC 62051]
MSLIALHSFGLTSNAARRKPKSHSYTIGTLFYGTTASNSESSNLRFASHTQPPFPPRTPGCVAANHLHSWLNAQTLMASPGPPLRNPSNNESEQDNKDFQENLGISLDSDEEGSPPPCLPHFNRRGLPPVQPFPHVNEAVAQRQQGRSGGANDKWNGYEIDWDSFAWAEDTVLAMNSKSADCQAFYGKHIQHHGSICKLCP